jgi:uncharacterized protein YcfJ
MHLNLPKNENFTKNKGFGAARFDLLAQIRTGGSMKRILSILLIVLTLAFAAGPIASAQPVVRHRQRHSRSFWKKHRNKLTVAGTAVAGAGLGAIVGGKKGAAIGTAVGAGSGALYTYKLRHRRRHRRNY